MNGDGDGVDLVIQTFDLDTGRTRTIGTVREGANPLGGGDTGDTRLGDGLRVVGTLPRVARPLLQRRRAIARRERSARTSRCKQELGVCATQADCPPSSTCVAGRHRPGEPR